MLSDKSSYMIGVNLNSKGSKGGWNRLLTGRKMRIEADVDMSDISFKDMLETGVILFA